MQQPVVILVEQLDPDALQKLLQRYGLKLEYVPLADSIPGSFWGESEAGLVADTVFVRPDTPAHSLLHEACHYICMPSDRRQALHTNAAGDYDEENAVCYLQILLADYLPPLNSRRIMSDMDTWGYSFRLGSALRWFRDDAEDARRWLEEHQLVDSTGNPTWQLRQ